MTNYTASNKAVYLLQYHIVWCPKYRRQILTGAIKNRLEQIIHDICCEQNLTIKTLQIMPDHVHLFVAATPRHTPYKIVKAIKGQSSNLLRKEFPELLKMPTLWTRAYFFCSIGNATEETIQKYIEDQWNNN